MTHCIDKLCALFSSCIQIDQEIRADEFNLCSFESWSQDLDLKAREKDALRNLIGMLNNNYLSKFSKRCNVDSSMVLIKRNNCEQSNYP